MDCCGRKGKNYKSSKVVECISEPKTRTIPPIGSFFKLIKMGRWIKIVAMEVEI